MLTTPFTRYNYARVSRFTCSRCGVFDVFERNVSSVTGLVTRLSQNRPWVRALLSYWIRKTPATEEYRPLIEAHLIGQIVQEQRLPGAEEQANNLIRCVGEHLESQQDPGGETPFTPDELVPIVGCLGRRGTWISPMSSRGAAFFGFRQEFVRSMSHKAAPLRASHRASAELRFTAFV